MPGESSIGSLLGGVGGLAIGGPVGAQVGSSLGGAIGGLFGARNAQKKVDASQPVAEDPNQISRLQEIDRTRRQIATGNDPLTRSRINEIQRVGATTQSNIARNTGGDVGGTVAGLLRAQRNVDSGVNQAFNQSQARLPFFENLSSQLSNRVAQRKLELNIRDQNQARAEQAQQQTFSNNAVSGLVGSLGGVAGGGLGSLLGGGGTNSLGVTQPGLSTPGINPDLQGTFQRGLSN